MSITKEFSNLVDKMEFHEFKTSGCTVPYVQLYCYVTNIEDFLQLCMDKEFNSEELKFKLQNISKSKAKRPNFEMYYHYTTIKVYPKEKLIVSGQGGLHYICQHIFDFVPNNVHSVFYPVTKREDWTIGKLFVECGKNKGIILEVKAFDILTGFMLTYKQIQKYQDTFSVWIDYMRKTEEET